MGQSIVQLQNAFIFQNKECLLKEVNIDVLPGEFVFLIGKTGTGKSSLIKTLYADLPLQEGAGSIADYDLSSIRQKDIPFLRRKLGVVFQDFKLLPDRSIFDNLQFVLKATGWKGKSEISTRITEVLTEVGMNAIEHKYPFELSGGEQQRVAIARSMANAPRVLLADEPTGNLDPDTAKDVFHHLSMITRATGTAALVVTHNQQLALKMDSILTISDGKIVSIG